MPFLEHTRELRKRIIRSAIVLGIAFFALVYFFNPIFAFLSAPVKGMGYELYAFKIQDGVLAAMNSCFWAAFLGTSPFWLSQLLGFVMPALDGRQKKAFWGFLAMSVLFLIAGFAFSYFVLIPMTIRFLLTFASEAFESLLSATSYLDFFLSFFFLTGLAFQFPLVMLLLAKAGIIDSAWIRKNRRIAIVGIFIIAAVITPPDVVRQIALALPMSALFELGALLCRLGGRRNARTTAEAADGESPEDKIDG